MLSVNTNAGQIAALRALSATNAQATRLGQQVTTGRKVSSPADDGATFAIAQNTRARIASYNSVLSGQEHVLGLLDTGIAGLETISDILLQMKDAATRAGEASLDQASRQAFNVEYKDLKQQIDTVAKNASFMGKNLISNTDSDTVLIGPAFLPPGTQPVTWNGQTTGQPQDGDLLTLNCSFASNGSTELPMNGQLSYILKTADASGGWTATEIASQPLAITPPGGGGTAVVSANAIMPALAAGTQKAVLQMRFEGDIGDPSVASQNGSEWYSTYLQDCRLSVDLADWTVGGNRVNRGYYVNGATVNDYITVMTGLDGATTALARSDVNTGSIGLSDTALDSTDSAATALGAVDFAQTKVQKYLQYYSAKAKMLEALQHSENTIVDTLQSAAGKLVDADMATTTAQMKAVQTRQQLAVQSLMIANHAPSVVLQLFRN